jgi:hypothetical protein
MVLMTEFAGVGHVNKLTAGYSPYSGWRASLSVAYGNLCGSLEKRRGLREGVFMSWCAATPAFSVHQKVTRNV